MFTAHFDNVSQCMVRNMKNNDELFNKVFRGLRLGGYADRIKVSRYNVLVLVNFPKPKPFPISSHPGYINININEGLTTHRHFGGVPAININGNEGYLIQDPILE